MNTLKFTTLFFAFFLVNLQALARDEYTPLDDSTETTIQLCPDTPQSIAYLENQPDATLAWPILAGAGTLVPLGSAVIPGPVVCTKIGGFMACYFSSIFPGIFGGAATVGGAVGTGILTFIYYKNSNVKKQHLEMAKLISDAYDLKNGLDSENSLHGYLRNYQDRFARDAQSALDLAEKIILADQANLFIPANEEVIVQKIKDFEAYASYQDAPKGYDIFQGLNLGQFFGQKPQEVVDALLRMTKEELENKKLAYNEALPKWDERVKNYIAEVKAAERVKIKQTSK